ncbi:MAG TPA: hypothetical protein VF283_17405 [Bryobacteraceae bacterium]
MARKESRGLPPDFDLNLPTDKPIELGDYLDEEAVRPSLPNAPEHLEFSSPPPTEAAVSRPLPAPPITAPYQRGYLSRQQLRPGAVPRKQLNATPETMRMLDDLLVQIRQQSMEKDVRISEIFHAMVLCVHEARAYLDLSAVPPRGRWGSPTAASLPVALKNAFMDAISRTRPRR